MRIDWCGRVDFDQEGVSDAVSGVALADEGRIWTGGVVPIPSGDEARQSVWVARRFSSSNLADDFERGSHG